MARTTPEEKVNLEIWEILQDIKEESLVVKKDGKFFYDTTKTVFFAGKPNPTRERKWTIIRKLAREKAIKIIEEIKPDWRGSRNGFYLKILEPKFSKIYTKYKKACDLTSYLNDYQKKTLKGDDLPEFAHVEVVKKEKQVSPRKKHKGQMFETGGGGGYYNRSHPIRPMKKQSAKEIVDGFSTSNYAFVLMVLKGVLSATEFDLDGNASYQLQSSPGQTLMQERQLLSKFEKLGLLRNLGEDGLFAIAKLKDVNTKTIRQIATEIKNRQSNLQTKPEGKSEGLKKKYNQILEEIRQPKQSFTKLEERYKKTLNEIKLSSKTQNTLPPKDAQEQNKPTLPPGWKLRKKGNIPKIERNGVVIFTFPNDWSNKYKYFKCLWKNYGLLISYKKIYEFETENIKYPKSHVTTTNRNIRNTINKLKKEDKFKKLPISIEINKGAKLTIKQ